MENQGYQHYRDQQGQNILEMNQNELLLALYDGLVKDELDKVRPMMIDLRDTFHAANKNCAEGRGGEVPPVGTQEAGG